LMTSASVAMANATPAKAAQSTAAARVLLYASGEEHITVSPRA
jgi:hypothetical protein